MTEEDWTSQRNEITYEESKRVMQGQKADVDDMDDKALYTVRLNAAILAIGATGFEISGIGNVNPIFAIISIIALVSSAVFGVIVYNESNILVGPKVSFLKKMRTQKSDDEWEEELLEKMGVWITDNQARVELNASLLNICQAFFILGVLTGTAAILGVPFKQLHESHVLVILVAAVIVYIMLIMYLRRTSDITS